jgi:hypothetical protein
MTNLVCLGLGVKRWQQVVWQGRRFSMLHAHFHPTLVGTPRDGSLHGPGLESGLDATC